MKGLTKANKKHCVEAEKITLFYQFDFTPVQMKKSQTFQNKSLSMNKFIFLSLHMYLADKNGEK